MPRLRPISLDKLKAGDREEALRVIRDVLLLTPRGISQRQKPTDYRKHDYSYRGKEAILRSAEGAEYWEARAYGYTNEYFYYTLKALGVTGTWVGEHRFSGIVYEAFADCTRHKATRSGRRLDRRMSRAWRQHIESGDLGRMSFPVRVSTPRSPCSNGGYRDSRQAYVGVEISAATAQEALQVAQAVFAGNKVENYGQAWREGEESEIMTANLKASGEITKKILQAQKEIAELQEHLANMEFLRTQIDMLATDFT